MKKTLAFLAIAVAGSMQAGTIYNSFGGVGLGFNPDSGIVVTDLSAHRPSLSFSSNTQQRLSEVDFVTSIGSPDATNEVTVQIEGDNGGLPDFENPLVVQSIVGQMGIGGDPDNGPRIVTWLPSTSLILSAGVTYWITFTTAGLPEDVTWNSSRPGVTGLYTFQNGNWVASENAVGAVTIMGADPTPEPATWLLFATGLGAVLQAGRRKAFSAKR